MRPLFTTALFPALLPVLALTLHASALAAAPAPALDTSVPSDIGAPARTAPQSPVTLAPAEETPACRALRLKAENARSGDPSLQRTAVPGTIGGDGRPALNGQKGSAYGERERLEARYLSQCP